MVATALRIVILNSPFALRPPGEQCLRALRIGVYFTQDSAGR